MHIVHVVRQFSPGIGGIENFVANLARQQVAQRHQVTIVTLDRLFTDPDRVLPEREWQDGYRIVRVPYRGSSRYPLAPRFLHHLGGADIVHVHAVDFFCDAAAWLHPLHGRPMVLSTHGGFFHTGYARRAKQVFFHTITRLSLRGYRLVLASSQPDYDLFARVRKHGLELVENGVDTRKFRNAGADTFRRHIVFIGRFAANKGVDRLIHLVAALGRREPDWRLTIIGIEWDHTATEYRSLAAMLGIAHRVDVRVGSEDATIRSVLATASFIASASRYEGFGISIVEGMSAGLWPVLSGIPAFRRLLNESRLGTLVDFDHPEVAAESLAVAAAELQRDWATRRAACIGFAGRYEWAAVATRIEALYRRALGSGRRDILGVPVQGMAPEEAIATIDGQAKQGPPTAIAFLNAHGATIARRRPDFREALGRMLVLNDGAGLALAGRLLHGAPFPANLNGTDFVPRYLAETRFGFRIFLLGARPDVVRAAADRLAHDHPRHRVVGTQHGYFAEADTPSVVNRIRESKADLLLVALGNPLQELWVDRHLAATGAKLAFSVGALFDFLAGAVPRAPRAIRRLRLEWAFRLLVEPRRLWRRYLIGNAAFLGHVLRQRMAPRTAAPIAAQAEPVATEGEQRARAA